MTAFDRLAAGYDREWSHAAAGRAQRQAVWRELADFFQPGDHVLDLGCGTGEDALWLTARGVRVTALDPSPAMVRHAQSRGVPAVVGELSHAEGCFHGILSNFGALNCVPNVGALRVRLAQLLKPGAPLAICVFGKYCAWETLWYLARLDFSRATRRWGARSHSQSLEIDVYYPTVAQITAALAPDFTLRRTVGIGLLVPPSYVNPIPAALVGMLATADRALASLPLVQACCDHQLLLFTRR